MRTQRFWIAAAVAALVVPALAQAERVMTVEQEMKKAHLALFLQIKNQLDATQQAKLRALRGHGERRGREPGPPPDAQ